MACIDSRMLSTSVASQCQTLREQLASLVARISVDTQTKPTTVTLAAHARRGLINLGRGGHVYLLACMYATGMC